jgi:hypothetical protein
VRYGDELVGPSEFSGLLLDALTFPPTGRPLVGLTSRSESLV